MNSKPEEPTGLKSIFMFEFPKRHFSTINHNQYSKSPPCIVNNLTWKISITKKKIDSPKDPSDALAVYLDCMGKSKLWSCYALVRFTLVSQKPDVRDITLEFKHLFSSVSNSQGYHTFINWDKVSRAEYGYISDDMVRIRVYVEADPPKNISIQDYDMKSPQSCDEWLALFENKLNDKIVRRISEEIRTVKYEKMKSFGKLSEEIKGLNEKVERVGNRNIRIMSEFLKKSLEVVFTSFYSKLDSLQLKDKLNSFHSEIVSVLEELRRIKSLESEDKSNKKSDSSSDSESESSSEEASETNAQCDKKQESEIDCEIIEQEKVNETIDIVSSESENDADIRKNVPSENTKVERISPKSTVVEDSTALTTVNLFKAWISEWHRESSKCCVQKLGCSTRGCGGHTQISPHSCPELESASHQCPAQSFLQFCESFSCGQAKIDPKCLKRKSENDNCSCSSVGNEPPMKKTFPEKVAVKEADTKENISDDDDEASYSSSSSESSQSSSTDGEKSQQNDQSSPIIRKMSRESIEKKNKMQKKI